MHPVTVTIPIPPPKAPRDLSLLGLLQGHAMFVIDDDLLGEGDP